MLFSFAHKRSQEANTQCWKATGCKLYSLEYFGGIFRGGIMSHQFHPVHLKKKVLAQQQDATCQDIGRIMCCKCLNKHPTLSCVWWRQPATSPPFGKQVILNIYLEVHFDLMPGRFKKYTLIKYSYVDGSNDSMKCERSHESTENYGGTLHFLSVLQDVEASFSFLLCFFASQLYCFDSVSLLSSTSFQAAAGSWFQQESSIKPTVHYLPSITQQPDKVCV